MLIWIYLKTLLRVMNPHQRCLQAKVKNWNEPIQPKSVDLTRHSKRLGSRHIHNEVELQKAMNGLDRVLCKTDLILIRRHT